MNPDVIEALAAINSAHERVEKAQLAAQAARNEYMDSIENANKLQRAMDQMVDYLREHAPEGTEWHYRYGGT